MPNATPLYAMYVKYNSSRKKPGNMHIGRKLKIPPILPATIDRINATIMTATIITKNPTSISPDWIAWNLAYLSSFFAKIMYNIARRFIGLIGRYAAAANSLLFSSFASIPRFSNIILVFQHGYLNATCRHFCMAQGIGYGKTILFGEHFVVYGTPAIGAALSQRAIVSLELAKETTFTTEIQGTIPEYTAKAISLVKAAMGVKGQFTITLTGDLPTVGGLGSSAAFSVALVRAFASHYKRQLSNEQVNSFAYEGEKAFHGTPSGIDNTLSTYGGIMEFKRGKTPKENEFSSLTLSIPLHLVIGMTGRSSPTKQMVEGVRKFKEADEVYFQSLMDEAFEIISHSRKALSTNDLPEIGRLMNQNQELLREIGISSDLNEKILCPMQDAGALGAKVTGGGGGGCCIALAKDLNHAGKILQKINDVGFSGLHTKLGLGHVK